ncbi:MAG TPA: hypothetical protein VFB14_08870 [Bryobacteraceae bacterium]|nr:hypothetical protein [Bryobacteraceae bacterium]
MSFIKIHLLPLRPEQLILTPTEVAVDNKETAERGVQSIAKK